jgi:polyisoprenoid-binding protein YceI
MKKILLISTLILSLGISATAQVLFTKNGSISFNATSKNSPEKIEATNKAVACKVNTTAGDVEFVVLIKSFVFKNQLMQQHFNENYVESDKYPKCNFKGKITNLSSVNFTKDGSYAVTVDGTLSLHGVDKKVSTKGTITVKGGKVSMSSTFNIKLPEYKINIPNEVKDKVAQDATIIVSCNLDGKK